MADSDTYEWRLVGTSLTAAATDPILPVEGSHFYYVLNESGTGELTIPLKCSAASLVSNGKLAVLYYRGAIRGSFLIENIRKRHADANEAAGQYLSISGRGGMSLLDRAVVASDGTTNRTRDFTSVTKGSILKTLIDEAQARGGLTTLTYDFTAVLDSDGVAWTDSETYKLNVGMKLTDVIRQFADTGIEFECNYSGTGFVLSAYKNGIGTDKSSSVFFRTGTNCQEVDTDQRGNDIRNALIVAYQSGEITLTDSASITTNGRREELLDARLAQTASSATTYGSAVLATKKDPLIGRTIAVDDGVPPYVFVNYILGDTITLDIEGTQTTDRILGIQCDFDGHKYSNVVIELNSLILTRNIKLQQDVDWLLNQWQTAHDAELLEVSYWAALGIGSDTATRVNVVHIIGTKAYVGMLADPDPIIGGVTAPYGLAIYDIPSGQWSVPSAPPQSYSSVLCMASSGVYLYVGGRSGSEIAPLGRYNTSSDTWEALGDITDTIGSPNGAVNALQFIGTDLYVGGRFYDAATVTVGGIVRLDTTDDSWHAVGTVTGSSTSSVHSLLASGTNLYAGINYNALGPNIIGGVSVDGLALWSGGSWTEVGGGLTGTVNALALLGSDVIIGGVFADHLAIWDGATLAMYGGGVNGVVYSLAVYLTDIYVGGAFTDVGNRIARYSGGAWWELTTGLNDEVYAITINGDDVIVGGKFTTAGDKPAIAIAEFFTNFEALLDYLENSSTFNLGAAIHSATAAAVTDASEIPFWDAVTSALRKITWANIRATLKTYFDTLYVSVTQTASRIMITNASGTPTTDAELTYDATYNQIKLGTIDSVPLTGTESGALIQGANESNIHLMQTFSDTATSSPVLIMYRGRGTAASSAAVQSGDTLFRWQGRGYQAAGNSGSTSGKIDMEATENFSGSGHGTKIQFYTTPAGSTTMAKTLIIGEGGLASSVTAGKTLTLAAVNNYTLTVPATGTAALLGTANVFTTNQEITGDIKLSSGADLRKLYVGGSASRILFQGGDNLDGSATQDAFLEFQGHNYGGAAAGGMGFAFASNKLIFNQGGKLALYAIGGKVGIGSTGASPQTPQANLDLYNGSGGSTTTTMHLVRDYTSGGYGGGIRGAYDVTNGERVSLGTLQAATFTEQVYLYQSGSMLIGTTTDGMTSGGSLAINKDLAHRGTKIGFMNTAPTTQQTVTGSRGANAALASLLTALANYGIIVDSSS